MANGNGVNGSVLVPKWVVGIAIGLITWGAMLQARLMLVEGTRFTAAMGSDMRRDFDGAIRDLGEELRRYVDDEIDKRHGGDDVP